METKELTGWEETEETLTAKTSLYQKILAVMQEVQAVPKDKTNDFHKYPYTSEAAVTKAVRDAMVKHGLVAIPQILDKQVERVDKNTVATIHYCLKIVDVETGQYESVCVVGQGIDTGDKAFYKAITGANKYALMKLFQIPSTDDPEADTEVDRQHSSNSKSSSKSAKQNSNLISDTQKNYLDKLKNSNNISDGLLQDYILAKYGKEGIDSLTKKEASELIGGIQKNGAAYLEDIELEEDDEI